MPSVALAQSNHPVTNWQNMDIQIDGIFGISTERTYKELLKKKGRLPVIVAVIDGGVDIEHPDLNPNIWTNVNEIPNNNQDDDANGYIDDIHGWNFMGSSKGSFHLDNIDLIRLLREERKKNPESLKCRQLQADLDSKRLPLKNVYERMKIQRNSLMHLVNRLGKSNPTLSELKRFRYRNEDEAFTLSWLVRQIKADEKFLVNFENELVKFQNQVDFISNINYNPRANNHEYRKKYHGNSDCKGLEPSHGTHVAGIIAGIRSNKIGPVGVADSVKIMVLRAIPDGDVLDEDLANAIRYAADNGAKIINLSVGKFTFTNRDIVEQAIRYAQKKDVLIIHAAGNEGQLQEPGKRFPSRNYLNGCEAQSWIEVGASGFTNDKNLAAWFSNFGKTMVDVYAPGVDINSTYPENSYTRESGTSMAAPVVSGLAAIIRSCFPNMTAIEVKNVIMNSVRKVNHKVISPSGEMVEFKDLCRSGGIVNAYNAIILAEQNNK